MRVLFVSDYPHLPAVKGGLQTTTHELCLAICTAGAEAAVLCGLADDDAEVAAARSDEDLGYLCMRAASPMQALALAASAWNASVIVVQTGRSLTSMVLAALRTGRPTAVYLHNVEVHQLGGMLAPDPCLLYLANSQFTADRWRAVCGLHCHVIPPIVDAERYLADASGASILFVNPTPIKGVERVFTLAAHCADLPFLIVESWHLDAHWRALCRSRAQALGNVEWLAPTDDMRTVYAQSRVLLMPSIWEESFGRTAVEAQLNGLPVLASRRGALPQIVGSGGLVLDPHEPVQAWAAALRRLLAEHDAFSAAARAQALGHCAATPLIVAELLSVLAAHTAR